MLNIYVNGLSGKMGSSITHIVKDIDDIQIITDKNIQEADVVVDFSRPEASLEIIDECIKLKKPIIIGTSGFDNNQLAQIRESSKEIPTLLSFNMSKGIYTLKKSIEEFLLNNKLKLTCLIEEVHHVHKVDSPSGTAIELKDHIESFDTNKNISKLVIKADRVGDIFGIHKVTFTSEHGVSEFKHEALSRNVFSHGVIEIARSIIKKEPGLYRLEDFFNNNSF